MQQDRQAVPPTDKVIEKFRRNGHILDPSTLTMTIEFIKQANHNEDSLAVLVSKLNEFTITEKCALNEKILKRVIDLLKCGKNNFSDHI